LLLLLLTSGDVEPNLGPSHAVRSLHVGTYNICSAPGKIGSIILSEFGLDILALCETRMKHGDPLAVMCDIAPDGYGVIHVHRSRCNSMYCFLTSSLSCESFHAASYCGSSRTFVQHSGTSKKRTQINNVSRSAKQFRNFSCGGPSGEDSRLL